jgi:hypothetical protein
MHAALGVAGHLRLHRFWLSLLRAAAGHGVAAARLFSCLWGVQARGRGRGEAKRAGPPPPELAREKMGTVTLMAGALAPLCGLGGK